jgi:hypothetical protein
MIALRETSSLFDSNNNLNLELLDTVLESFVKTQTSMNQATILKMLQLIDKSNSIDICRKFFAKSLDIDKSSLLTAPILNVLAQLIHKYSYPDLAQELRAFFHKYANLNLHSALIKVGNFIKF